MEGSENEIGVDDVASPGAPAGTRWNPTKDQITLLEGLYKQGIRTPTAEQIQQITARLKVFGHIEGKNVFYWFQNHKARQRQKQKQENLAYFNRYFHKAAAPVVYPPSNNFPNVVCSPYYLSQSELGFYQRYPKVLLQGGISTKRTMLPTTTYNGETQNQEPKQETLPLFPLEPSCVLQTRNSTTSTSSVALSNPTTPSSFSEMDKACVDQHRQPNFFDFFSAQMGPRD